MNSEVKSRIAAINNNEAIKLFFSLLKDLIVDLKFSAENEKLSINVRNDYRKRISVIINGRLVLFIKDGDVLGFMINEADVTEIEHKIPIKETEKFREQDPQALLISVDYNLLKSEVGVIKPLWLKSCRAYEPMQSKSQYRKNNIPELYRVALDENLLMEYLEPSPPSTVTFATIVNELREYIKGEDNVLSEFTIQPLASSRSGYVWISDRENIIGNTMAHYEIQPHRDKLRVWIHFEGSQERKV